MKWALKVCIARSAWFHLCCPGGISSYSMLLCFMHSFIAGEHSLLSTCFLTPNPAACIWFIHFWYTLTISPSVLFFIGPAMMWFASRWTATMMYPLPRWDMWGNALVWLVWTSSERSSTGTKILFSFDGGSGRKGDASPLFFILVVFFALIIFSKALCLVDWIPCRWPLRWPFAVSSELGMCLWMSATANLATLRNCHCRRL